MKRVVPFTPKQFALLEKLYDNDFTGKDASKQRKAAVDTLLEKASQVFMGKVLVEECLHNRSWMLVDKVEAKRMSNSNTNRIVLVVSGFTILMNESSKYYVTIGLARNSASATVLHPGHSHYRLATKEEFKKAYEKTVNKDLMPIISKIANKVK